MSEIKSRWLEHARTDYWFLRAPAHEKEMLENVIFFVTGMKPDLRFSRVDVDLPRVDTDGGRVLWMHHGLKKQDALKVDELMELFYDEAT